MANKKSGPKPREHVPECSFDDCGRDSRSGGLCSSHWKQKNVYKIELRPLRKWNAVSGSCIVPGCAKDRQKLEYCALHYGHSRSKTGISSSPKRPRLLAEYPCSISGCAGNSDNSSKMCRSHKGVSECYKLTSVQLQVLFDTGCQVCGKTTELHVDHDHACCDRKISGRKRTCGDCVRGILCKQCNLGLGWFGDDLEKMKSAIAYLKR